MKLIQMEIDFLQGVTLFGLNRRTKARNAFPLGPAIRKDCGAFCI